MKIFLIIVLLAFLWEGIKYLFSFILEKFVYKENIKESQSFIKDFSGIAHIKENSLNQLINYNMTTKEFFTMLSKSFYMKLDTKTQIVLFATINAYLNVLLLVPPEGRVLKFDGLLVLFASSGLEREYIKLQDGIWEHCIKELKYNGIHKKEVKRTLTLIEEILREMVLLCPSKKGGSIYSYLKDNSHK